MCLFLSRTDVEEERGKYGDRKSQYLPHHIIILHMYVHTVRVYFSTFHYTQNTISNSSFSLISNRFGVTCPHVEEDGH